MVKRIPVKDESQSDDEQEQEVMGNDMKSADENSENSTDETKQGDTASSLDSSIDEKFEDVGHLIAELESKVDENYDKYVRAVADLENFKKRAIKERSELIKYAGESLARDVLEVVDGLELACAQPQTGTVEEFVAGVKLILDKFKSILEHHSIKGETAIGQRFDPAKHEAMAMQPTADVASGNVMDEYRRAYYFKDRLLRPGQVVVATELSPTKQESSES